jgi:hypothetical protein
MHTLAVRPDPSAPAQVRRLVSEIGDGCLPTELLEIALLLATAMVTDAVIRGGDDVTVSIECSGGEMTVVVKDPNPELPNPRATEPEHVIEDRQLVAELALESGVTPLRAGRGTLAWFRLAASDDTGPQGSRVLTVACPTCGELRSVHTREAYAGFEETHAARCQCNTMTIIGSLDDALNLPPY